MWRPGPRNVSTTQEINICVVVAENGLRGSMYIVKYMNRLEFSSNMEVSYFYKMDYVNIAE